MTRVRVKPRPFHQGCRKNDAFTHSATLPTGQNVITIIRLEQKLFSFSITEIIQSPTFALIKVAVFSFYIISFQASLRQTRADSIANSATTTPATLTPSTPQTPAGNRYPFDRY